MIEDLYFLLIPFLMCVALVGIHCYLGLHVLARGVIFVDLALAQVAAFGAALAFLMGYEHDDPFTYLISFSVTLIVALYLSYANKFQKKISQEAIIGIIYALFSASIILLIDKMSHGAEHLKQSLIGQLLWVTWEDLLKVTIVYSVVGAIHFIYRNKFINASIDGANKWIWDFLFYALFGAVITSSVHYAGILLVFSFLIVPSLISSFFYNEWRSRLIFGWILGIILSLVGMLLSYYLDLPSGAVIVTVFTICPLILILFK